MIQMYERDGWIGEFNRHNPICQSTAGVIRRQFPAENRAFLKLRLGICCNISYDRIDLE